MDPVGYEFLRETLRLSAFAPRCPAYITSATKLERVGNTLAVPRPVAPHSRDPRDPLEHVLFALKHEGTNLQILAEAMPRIPAADIHRELSRAPNGAYIRMACYLWEAFNCAQLEAIPPVGGKVVPLFDPDRYITSSISPTQRNAKWRVAFNGLGSLTYCATVLRTPSIEQACNNDIMGKVNAFIRNLPEPEITRAISWAFLHETESSFAIEKEAPSEDKARRFVSLLHQAHERRTLSEEYLVELQNSIIKNPYDAAFSFRWAQNWLQGPHAGALGVSYIPPEPEILHELMSGFMDFANTPLPGVDPIVKASVESFGFVFAHPFMDGNGRLSRFLFHHALCCSGKLDNGLLLPVSVAMKKNEAQYLAALQSFSRPARERWSVLWIDDNSFDMRFNGSASLYRFWDATPCVEFGFAMAEQALEVELRQETEYLARYDEILRGVNDRFDIRGNELAVLIRGCLQNRGVVSLNRRKQFALSVPAAAFDLIEELAHKTAVPQNRNAIALDEQAPGHEQPDLEHRTEAHDDAPQP